MERKAAARVTGFHTIDGGGVNLVRVLGNTTVKVFDPILMLDSFDSTNPADYRAGFPMHPHRGIETISYVSSGKMLHRDSTGGEGEVADGSIQWMTAGSGIMHEERIPEAKRLLGVQLWLNLPAKDKMVAPQYHAIHNSDIEEIPFDGGYLRLLAGTYKEHTGYQGSYLPLDYYEINLKQNASLTIPTDPDKSAMIFTLLGEAAIGGDPVPEKTAVKLTAGDSVTLKGLSEENRILFMSSTPLNEPVAWAGPIVMNTREELETAFDDLDHGTFLKEKIDYSDK